MKVKVIDTRIKEIEYCTYEVEVPDEVYNSVFDRLSIEEGDFDTLVSIVGGLSASVEKNWTPGTAIAVPMKSRDIYKEDYKICTDDNSGLAPMETYVHPFSSPHEEDYLVEE